MFKALCCSGGGAFLKSHKTGCPEPEPGAAFHSKGNFYAKADRINNLLILSHVFAFELQWHVMLKLNFMNKPCYPMNDLHEFFPTYSIIFYKTTCWKIIFLYGRPPRAGDSCNSFVLQIVLI